MSHHPWNAKLLSASQLRDESVNRFGAEGWIGTGRVDEIGVVCDNQREAGSFHGIPKVSGMVGIDGRDIPAVDIASEDLQALAPGFHGAVNRTRESTRNGLVGSQRWRGVSNGSLQRSSTFFHAELFFHVFHANQVHPRAMV